MFSYKFNWKRLPDPPEPRLLNLDVENGPKWGWGPGGYTYSGVFCIARKWVGDDENLVTSVLIDWRQDDETVRQLLAPVYADIAEADGFLGHNFSHDTGLLVGLAKDFGIELPDMDKQLVDTMRSVPSSTGAIRSLEALCKQFGLGDKPHIDNYTWVDAWIRWKPEALAVVRNRCEMDVVLTERLYRKEQELGWLL